MWFKTVLCVSFVVTCVFSEDIFENNEIDSDDFLPQDLVPRTKKSSTVFNISNKNVAERATDSEDDIKYILARDIKQRIEALEELNDAFEAVKVGIDSNKREIEDDGNAKSILLESKNTPPETEISLTDPSETDSVLSRTSRQYCPLNNRCAAIEEMPSPTPSVTYTKSDSYLASYNPSVRTFTLPGVQGGFEANMKGATGVIKEGTAGEGGAQKTGGGGEVIKQGGIQGGYIRGYDGHVHHGGGIGATVHPIKQIKYLLPNFLSALTAAIGGATGGAAGAGLGAGGGVGGFGGGLGGGFGGGLGGDKHKHKHIASSAVTVNKVTPQPIKIPPVAHAPAVHVVPVKKEKKKEKGGFFISKNIFFGKIGGEQHHGSYIPEGHYYNHPSYSIHPNGGHSGYSYLSPFNFQYSERSPYYMAAYLPEPQSSLGAGLATYPQGNSYLEPAYLPFSQGQYYYPIDVKSFNNDGSLPQFQLYQDPSISINQNNENAKTITTQDTYVRSNLHKSDETSTSEVNLEKVKADIEEEQQRIQKLRDGLKSYARHLDISQSESGSKKHFAREIDDLKSSWDSLKEEMKKLNQN